MSVRLPVYRKNLPLETPAQRQQAFEGVVSASFVVIDIMRGVLHEQFLQNMHLRIHDAGFLNSPPEPPGAQNLMFDSNRLLPSSAAVSSAASLRAAVLSPAFMRPIRVLVAKPGLDGHDRGAKVVAASLRDAGMEVIYTGLHQTPEMIATAAVQEDVDVVGLSILSGAHMTLFPRVLELLRAEGRGDILVTGGGIIPREDMDALQAMGTGRLFGPGTPTSDLIDYIKAWFTERSAQEA